MESRRELTDTQAAQRPGLLDRLVRFLAIAYPVTLFVLILAFRFIGERFWATTIGLYLPRIGFALPLPVVTLLVLWRLPRRWLLSQLVALVLVLFPLMGLRLPGAPGATAGAFHLRLFTMNTAQGQFGTDKIIAEVQASGADVVLLQETTQGQYADLRQSLPGYFHQDSGQFWLASRFPLEELDQPPFIPHAGKMRSPRFVSYVVKTPVGRVRIYNVHIISPRDALDEVHGEGLKREIASGRLFRGTAAGAVDDNTQLRIAQLQAISDGAHRSADPVLIAGDTNLPTLSWALGHYLGDFQDGFSQAGSGFGYSFPAGRRTWMRIDRILGDDHFRFLSFKVLRSRASDHYAVMADLELRPGSP
jgi:endonuclease/exonuclease/phosphatase (EEP) superfamily protein YafD